MCYCGDNPASAYRETVRVARKEHRCYECGRTIAKGDLYQLNSGVWDGGPASFKWCHTCTTVANIAQGLDLEWRLDWRAKITASSTWEERASLLYIEPFCFTFGSLLECVNELVDALCPPHDPPPKGNP